MYRNNWHPLTADQGQLINMAAINKRSCAYLLQVSQPLITLAKVCELLTSKGIIVDNLQFQLLESGDAKLVIHCAVSADRIAYIGRHFENMKGVIMVDWMKAQIRSKRY